MNAPTVARWESRLEKVRERRLSVLLERDDLPDDWIGGGCLWVSIEHDLGYYRQLDQYLRGAISKSNSDEQKREQLATLEKPTDRLERLESWIEQKERRGERDGPPPDSSPPRQLVTVSSLGANAPPVSISSNSERFSLAPNRPRRSVDLVT